MKFSLSLLTAAVCAAASVIRPVARDEHMSVNPSNAIIASAKADLHLPGFRREPLPATNAERLARGLPIKVPRRHYNPSRRTDGPAEPATSPKPPTPPTKYTRIIQVRDVDTEEDLGYVYQDTNSFGEYGIDSDITKALQVEFSPSTDGSPFDIKTLNGPAKFSSLPFFGGLKGFASTNADLGPGSFHYTFIGNTAQTPANSPPVDGPNSFTLETGIPESIESAIWKYDATKEELTAQWINTDGSKPTIYSVYYSDAPNAIMLTGDVTAFRNNFGPANQITFHLITIPVPPV